jgi:adenine-specific DNA-methyltransferase
MVNGEKGMGVGSELIAAMLHDRKGIWFEISDEYIAIAHNRLKDYLNNNLKSRPLDKPVYKTTGREKVSQVPLSWVNDAA